MTVVIFVEFFVVSSFIVKFFRQLYFTNSNQHLHEVAWGAFAEHFSTYIYLHQSRITYHIVCLMKGAYETIHLKSGDDVLNEA